MRFTGGGKLENYSCKLQARCLARVNVEIVLDGCRLGLERAALGQISRAARSRHAPAGARTSVCVYAGARGGRAVDGVDALSAFASAVIEALTLSLEFSALFRSFRQCLGVFPGSADGCFPSGRWFEPIPGEPHPSGSIGSFFQKAGIEDPPQDSLILCHDYSVFLVPRHFGYPRSEIFWAAPARCAELCRTIGYLGSTQGTYRAVRESS